MVYAKVFQRFRAKDLWECKIYGSVVANADIPDFVGRVKCNYMA